MKNINDAGNVENVGSSPQLPRLNPREIAVLPLPGFTGNVMDSTDAEFQYFVNRSGIDIDDSLDDGYAWSFDDKCRFINHLRKYGIDPFATPNENNSPQEQKQFANNSESELIGELFEEDEVAPIATIDGIEVKTVSGLMTHIESMLGLIEKSSEPEQK